MQKNAPFILGIAGILAIGIIGAGILHANGYVVTGTGIYKGGSLSIISPVAETTVFIDNTEYGTVTEETATPFIIDGIGLGEHDVIVSHPAAWPWVERLTFASEEITAVHPVLIPREPRRSVIPKNDPAFAVFEQNFTRAVLPTPDTPLASNNGEALAWVVENEVQVRANGEGLVPFSGRDPVTAVAWYPDRDDVLIIASGGQIFAIGIQPTQPQNFLPLYNAPGATFAASPLDPTLYIKNSDGTAVLLYYGLE